MRVVLGGEEASEEDGDVDVKTQAQVQRQGQKWNWNWNVVQNNGKSSFFISYYIIFYSFPTMYVSTPIYPLSMPTLTKTSKLN